MANEERVIHKFIVDMGDNSIALEKSATFLYAATDSKFCQGRKIGRRLEDSADLSTSDCLEFYGPGSKQARPGATDAGGTTKPGLWCITGDYLLAADAPEPEPHVCTGCIGDGPCEAEHEEPSVSVDDVDAADAYDEDRQEGERVR